MDMHFKPMILPDETTGQVALNNPFEYFAQYPVLLSFLDVIPVPVLILNDKRRAVYSNKALLEMTGTVEMNSLFGLLPGEVFKCIHAMNNPGCCGTTDFCSTCGALKSILTSQKVRTDMQECRILKKDNEALDLKVYATQLVLDEEKLTIFTVTDVSDEKRRKTLERIFFHDLLNTASSVKTLAYSLENSDPEDAEQFRSHLVKLSDKLVDEICAQRDITAAEHNELTVYLTRVNTFVLLNDVFEQFNYYSKDKKIIIDKESDTCDFYTDKILIRRILTNMLKNAVEATIEDGYVTIGSTREGDYVRFWVNNPGYMSRDVQLQVFQRSFSTKGFGRGLGTYSMKLLAENYLDGKVEFTTNEATGTTFFCKVPMNIE